jgi:hypothetical protein
MKAMLRRATIENRIPLMGSNRIFQMFTTGWAKPSNVRDFSLRSNLGWVQGHKNGCGHCGDPILPVFHPLISSQNCASIDNRVSRRGEEARAVMADTNGPPAFPDLYMGEWTFTVNPSKLEIFKQLTNHPTRMLLTRRIRSRTRRFIRHYMMSSPKSKSPGRLFPSSTS